FGDNRPSDTTSVVLPPVFKEIVKEIKVLNPLAVIGTGDHTGEGSIAQIDKLYELLNESGLENIWLAIGNHDVRQGKYSYWFKKIAPEYYKIDDIPGWRIAIVNSEASLSEWRRQLEDVLKDAGDRNVVLIFHRPAYPDVQHNLASDKVSILVDVLDVYDRVKIVLQGHWHGYGYMIGDGITWIVTGGAGAPLHSSPTSSPGATLVLGKHHYLCLILYPNKTFSFTPVLAGPGSGMITITNVNGSAIRIRNGKLDIYRKPVAVPVRVKVNCGKWVIYSVILVPPSSDVIVNYKVQDNTLVVACNAHEWYAYAVPLGQQIDKAIVETPVNGVVKLELEGLGRISLGVKKEKALGSHVYVVLVAIAIAAVLVYVFVIRRKTSTTTKVQS
ncbi:MAG: hypothetical protein DRJ66_02140, partial [Thermoprotei archaeon]